MSNTYAALYYHVIFSTKHRRPWIKPDFEERVWPYLGGIARENEMTALKVGGIEDHVHILLSAPAKIAPSKAAQLIKGGSSKWIHETFPALHGTGHLFAVRSAIPSESALRHHRKQWDLLL